MNPDIRVGDAIDFAYSIRTQFGVFNGIYSPARVTMTDIDRGASATEMQAGTGQIPAAELTRIYDERWIA